MTKELKKRIFTSILLFLLISFCIFIDIYVSLIALIIISFLTWLEFNRITNKIYNKKNKFLLNTISIFSFLYLILFTLTTFAIIDSGVIIFIFILLVCIFSDLGGYIIGKTFKGKKLTKISPNKTFSGTFGSFIFSVFPLIFFNIIFIYTKNNEFLIRNDNFFENIFLCLYLSLICQLGDLFISYFKRLAKVKDTGNILPGHGGVLDRIDGIIFAIPSVIAFLWFF
tara:strand:- start:21501 stop:22178 length:678 start_codon:yes stop_codon:yes gene_type:complete